MELVYLWVEDYKNIKKQGFNFSPRFNCHYDEEKNELTIDENDDYIKNFFGENINVTAIVGKNGSGKSSILECFDSLDKALILYRVNDTFYYHSHINLNVILDDNMIQKKTLFEKLDYFIYYSDKLEIEEKESSQNLSKHRILLNKHIIGNMICNSYVTDINFELTTFMYIPKSIEVNPVLNDVIAHFVSDYQNSIPNFSSIDSSLDDKAWEKERKNIRNQQFAKEDNLHDIFYEHNYDEYHKFLILWYIQENGYDDESQLEDKKFLLSEYEYESSESKIDEGEFFKYFKQQSLEIDRLSEKDKRVYFEYYKDYFDFDFIDFKKRRYNNLSHGERTIFGQLLNIYYFFINSNTNNLLFLFDEPEISLHPNWQKQYFNELISLLQTVNCKNDSGLFPTDINLNTHFVFTSHSPFLLSDIPKQNIIFLDTYKKEDKEIQKGEQEVGNCKVLKYDEVFAKKQTFGANIHTLLSDSFFMKDGLMGEFAKQKINKIIDFFNKKNEIYQDDKENLLKIIDSIGEPFLKEKLLSMYNEKYPKSKQEKIAELEAEIQRLKTHD